MQKGRDVVRIRPDRVGANVPKVIAILAQCGLLHVALWLNYNTQREHDGRQIRDTNGFYK